MNVTKIDTLLANRLGKAVVEFPSHHAGYVSHPRAFADQLSAVLNSNGKTGRIKVMNTTMTF